jgi:DNA repair exonuclease SbcCD ATPase subunit
MNKRGGRPVTTENSSEVPRGIRGGADSSIIRRAPRISGDDVLRAADDLVLEGLRPTIDRVRVRLGRGSPNTIQEHLDTWWTKLGARLRDIPGQEVPGLPEPVSRALSGLWNQALFSARESLDQSLGARENALNERESHFAAREQKLLEKESTIAARAAAHEEGLTLARDQLAASNQRADRLEISVQAREADVARLQRKLDECELEVGMLREKFELAAEAHQRERLKLEERYAAAESRWLTEVDRARQQAKQLERAAKELQTKAVQTQAQHDGLQKDLLKARTELRKATVFRSKLEKRLESLSQRSEKSQAKARAKSRPTAIKGT